MSHFAAAGLQDAANDYPLIADAYNLLTFGGKAPLEYLLIGFVAAITIVSALIIRRKKNG